MKTIQHLFFVPPQSATIYWLEDGLYQGQTSLSTTELSKSDQLAIEEAMLWLAERLPVGMTTLQQVVLDRHDDIALNNESGEPTGEKFAQFTIDLTGSNAQGATARITMSSFPGPETDAITEIWEKLVALINFNEK